MKITKINIHQGFYVGSVDRQAGTDFLKMTDTEADRLLAWFETILQGGTHVGTNKPSWLANGVFIPGREIYRDNGVWHYHCGPYDDAHPPAVMTDNQLSLNYSGKVSGSVYHYTKNGDSITVMGFTRNHIPFPDPASTKNPLRTRLQAHNIGKVIDFSSISSASQEDDETGDDKANK